jgi:L-iditol 2-dehydrogenase
LKTLVVDKHGGLHVQEAELPEFNECQALVKTLSCGICNGTDAKLIHQSFKNFGSEKYPLMLGHEGVGRVVKLGAKVTSYRTGDIVLLSFADAQPGLGSGWGSFSEYGVVCDKDSWDTTRYGPVPECAYAQSVLPESIDPVDAAMIITLREVLSSIKRFGIDENASVAIFGCGPVGLTFIKIMKLLGVKRIIAFDIVPEKLRDAQNIGADYAFNSKEVDCLAASRGIYPDGLAYVIDAVGNSAIINQAMPLLADQGKICCYGISANLSADIDWSQAPYNWQMQFQQFPSKVEEGLAHDQIIKWLESGLIDLKDFISDYYPFEDILKAFEKLENRGISKKGIVVYQESEE